MGSLDKSMPTGTSEDGLSGKDCKTLPRMTEQKTMNGPFIGFPWARVCPNAVALPCLRHPGYITQAREGVDWAQV